MTDPAFLRLVMVGADGSAGARPALEWTAAIASATGAAALAVHVLTYNRELVRDLTLDTMRTWRRDLDHELHTAWIAPLSAAGIDHQALLIEADSPAVGLLEAADAEHADLLVVGTKGHGGVAGRVLGSTGYKLTHHAHCPVVVVPAEWDA